MPANAGIQIAFVQWIPACAGMTTEEEKIDMPRQPAVYIMTNRERGTLYVGITGWLKERVHAHREGFVDGFTKKYALRRLAWFELHADFPAAIERETRIKKWKRAWKFELIEKANPTWQVLWGDLLD